ncbi:MAG TPA: sigma 54-interacting transcriptional regulator, partial [Myxococcales bacterium]|nr:sigma 54-interacting transcriptional regulator [Myxococcales bacterium]
MKLYVLRNGSVLRAWELSPGVYLVGSGPRCDRVLDPRDCPQEILCQVEAQRDRLLVSEIGEGISLVGPKGPAPLVALRSFDSLTAGPFQLGALEELRPPDFFEGQPGEELSPTAPADGILPPPKETLVFQVLGARGRRLVAVKNGFRLGRDARCHDNGIRFQSPAVSAQHAVVYERRDGYHLVDAGSTHGTFVNGVRLAPGVELRLEAGMVIQLSRQNQVPKIEVLAAADLLQGAAAGGLVGESAAIKDIYAQIYRLKDGKFPILLFGETGTGKEVLAAEIARLHNPRKRLTVVDCTTLTETLLEAELFGTVAGAFTDGVDRAGLVEEAEGGVLFLDEIGELPLALQAKLLRFLQEKTFRRQGSNKYVEVNCRVVAATHRNLPQMVAEGRFRQDLYERLQGCALRIPPLRERKEDILPIAKHFLGTREAPNLPTLSRGAAFALVEHDWPGNVRELLRVLEISAFRSEGAEIEESTVRALLAERTTAPAAGAEPTLRNGPERVRSYERALVAEALARHG